MSLLRRRCMKINDEKYIIYVYDGYIGTTEDADAIPAYNSKYPKSVATSSIAIEKNDLVVVNTSRVLQRRYRLYDENKNYKDFGYENSCTAEFDGYIRFVWHMGVGTIESAIVTKADGTVINYDIIDMR